MPKITEILGDDKAVANLKKLYDMYPEMFKDTKEISHMVKEVVSKPDLIMKNPKAETEKDFIVAKQTLNINNKKMGDIGISNKNGVNGIFHANQKRIGNLKSLKNRNLLQVETPTLSTDQNGVELIDKNLSGTNQSNTNIDTNALSAIDENIIPQNQSQSQESLGKNNPSDSKQEKMNALREQVNNIAKNKTNSPKDLSPKIDKER